MMIVCLRFNLFGQVLHFKASVPEMIYFKNKYLLLCLLILSIFLACASDGKTFGNI